MYKPLVSTGEIGSTAASDEPSRAISNAVPRTLTTFMFSLDLIVEIALPAYIGLVN